MVFWIGAVKCRLRLPWSSSLKDRRQVVRSLTDGAQTKCNVSPADLGPSGAHQEAELGFAAAGSAAAELEKRLDILEKFLERCEAGGHFEIVEITREVFTYGDISD